MPSKIAGWMLLSSAIALLALGIIHRDSGLDGIASLTAVVGSQVIRNGSRLLGPNRYGWVLASCGLIALAASLFHHNVLMEGLSAGVMGMGVLLGPRAPRL